MYRYGDQKTTLDTILSKPSALSSSAWSNPSRLARLAGQQALKIHLSPPRQHWD